MRERREDLARWYEGEDEWIKSQMETLENLLLAYLNHHKEEGVRCEAGTFFKQEEIKVRGEDWGAFYDWIIENDALDALQRRIKVGFIQDYMNRHDGALPPGVAVTSEWKVKVRKANGALSND